jgi:hypothetical protein
MTTATFSLTDGHIMVGDSSGAAADVAMSGDATIDNTGAVAVNNVICLNDFYTDGATTHTDGTLDSLYTATIPANTLSNDGDKIRAVFAGQHTQGTNSIEYQVAVTFASNTIKDTGQFVAEGTEGTDPCSFMVTVEIIRSSSSTARTVCRFSTDASLDNGVTKPADYNSTVALGCAEYHSLTGLDFTNSIDLVLQGASSGTGAAAGDVTAKMGTVIKFKHA